MLSLIPMAFHLVWVPFEPWKGNKNQKAFQSWFLASQKFLNIHAILIAEECILEKLTGVTFRIHYI